MDWKKKGKALICDGGVKAMFFRSTKPPNYGRYFQKCANKSCSFFKWINPAQTESDCKTINTLVEGKKKLEELNKEMDKKLHILEEENAQLRDKQSKHVVDDHLKNAFAV